MKVLALTPLYLPLIGGIELLVDNLAEGLRSYAIDVVVLTDALGELPPYEVLNGVPVYRFDLVRSFHSARASQPLTLLRQIGDAIERERPDVIHLHSVSQASAFYLDRLLRKVNKRPSLVVTQHGILEPVDQINIARNLLLEADVVTGVSDAALNSALVFSGRTARSLRIYNGVPKLVDNERDRTVPLRHTLLCVGRMQREKGFDTAIEALAVIRRRGIDAQLLLAGHGEHRAEFDALVSRLEISEHVKFLGVVDRSSAQALISECSLLFVPSRTHEGFSLAAAEAAMAGTPCIASNIGGLPETVAHGETGLIVPSDDPEALADAAIEIIADERVWLQMSDAARKRALDRFDLSRCVAAYAQLYDSLR